MAAHCPFETLDSRRFEFGERARWDGADLQIVDSLAGDLWQSRGGTARLVNALHLVVPLGAANLTLGGGLVLAAGDGVTILKADGLLDWLGRSIRGISVGRPRSGYGTGAQPH